jgi:hypothetical protein
MNSICRRLLLAATLVPLTMPWRGADPLHIETTQVDGDALHGATFQSNNQKVVSNSCGIFMTHLRTRNEKYTAQQWRLSQSTDGGRTFKTLHEAVHPTNPPVLETDSAGNLYVGRPDFVNLDVSLDRFLAAEDYRRPHTSSVPKSAAGKYSMCLDEPRGQVCYFSHSGMFVRFGLDGAVRSAERLVKRGDGVVSEYTSLQVDSHGTLHAAWTSLKVEKRLYWSIHYLQSPDGGTSWRTMAGQPVTLPVAADETGPADRITLDDEFDVSTWLSNFLVKDGKVHFLYVARTDPPRQHYVRYDHATGQRELDRQPEFRGDKLALSGLDGFFATDPRTPNSPLYCVSHDARQPRLACLVSHDNGTTWRDHAVSDPFTRPYAIGGCREITPDGWIIGSFTEVLGEGRDLSGRVHFIRIPAIPAAIKGAQP